MIGKLNPKLTHDYSLPLNHVSLFLNVQYAYSGSLKADHNRATIRILSEFQSSVQQCVVSTYFVPSLLENLHSFFFL